MKQSNLLTLLVTGLLLVAVTGCKKTPQKPVTVLGSGAKVPEGSQPNPPITTPNTGGGGGPRTDFKPIPDGPGPTSTQIPPFNPNNPPELPGRGGLEVMDPIPGALAAETVYFDFDRSNVKASEKSKLEAVAAYLKNQPTHKVEISGNCDERGTEEYNRSLGERRALAAREYLLSLGIAAERVFTISYGEDKPADPGHDESAWSKNRRDEFLAYRPKQ